MTMPEWIASVTLGQVLTIITMLAVTAAASKGVARPMRRFSQLMDDIAGEPARPGFERRPGILERMQLLEAVQMGLVTQIAQLSEEVHRLNPNPKEEE